MNRTEKWVLVALATSFGAVLGILAESFLMKPGDTSFLATATDIVTLALLIVGVVISMIAGAKYSTDRRRAGHRARLEPPQ